MFFWFHKFFSIFFAIRSNIWQLQLMIRNIGVGIKISKLLATTFGFWLVFGIFGKGILNRSSVLLAKKDCPFVSNTMSIKKPVKGLRDGPVSERHYKGTLDWKKEIAKKMVICNCFKSVNFNCQSWFWFIRYSVVTDGWARMCSLSNKAPFLPFVYGTLKRFSVRFKYHVHKNTKSFVIKNAQVVCQKNNDLNKWQLSFSYQFWLPIKYIQFTWQAETQVIDQSTANQG